MTWDNPIAWQCEMQLLALSAFECQQTEKIAFRIEQSAAACAGIEGSRNANHVPLVVAVQATHGPADRGEFTPSGKTDGNHRFRQPNIARRTNTRDGKIQTRNSKKANIILQASCLRLDKPNLISVKDFNPFRFPGDMTRCGQRLRHHDYRRTEHSAAGCRNRPQLDNTVAYPFGYRDSRQCK